MTDVIGGIEGGGSHSEGVLLLNGKILAFVEGASTNQWLVGRDTCLENIHNMLEEAKCCAGLKDTVKLKSLGLCLSGCVDDQICQSLKDELVLRFPNVSDNLSIDSDTLAAIYAASDSGGIVLISGTGSNAFLLNPDGSNANCGGWGHMGGDEGSAWWLSHRAVKTIFDEDDNYILPKFCTDIARKIVWDHLGLTDRNKLVKIWYNDFNKSHYAAMARKFHEAADAGDPFCASLFHDAGAELAKHIVALIPKIHPSLLSTLVPVICVGKMWNSWSLLKPGFISVLRSKKDTLPCTKLHVVKLKVSGAIGAAIMGAKRAGLDIEVDYCNNVELMCDISIKDL